MNASSPRHQQQAHELVGSSALGRNESLCLTALLKLGENDGGDRFIHEPERIAALTGLREYDEVRPALRRLAQLGLCEEHDAPAMPLRYRILREAATRALGFAPGAEAGSLALETSASFER